MAVDEDGLAEQLDGLPARMQMISQALLDLDAS